MTAIRPLLGKRVRFLLLLLVPAMLGWPAPADGTALDDYVAAPDENYTYSLVNTIPGGILYTAYILDMTSQAWRTSEEVDRTLWQHWLTIVVPTFATSDKGMLVIGAGSNGGSAPTVPDDTAVFIAVLTNTVVAYLEQVPNQPLTFAGEDEPRSEDAIIAYSFDKYVTTGDGTWPVLLPMVKSAVRAMDTVQEFVPGVTGGAVNVAQFLVGGLSKRGWTTWLTGAVDSRVIAMGPLVIDMLNMDVQMDHHRAAYGFYSPPDNDYVKMNIFARMYTPEGQALLEIVDPYEYRDRYASIPVYATNATGDQLFLPDSAQFYFDDLPGEKHLRYVPNTDHGLADDDALTGLLAYYEAVVDGSPRPQFSWTVEQYNKIVVQTVDPPSQVNLWQATAMESRDFRLETIGPAWTSSTLEDQGGGVYAAEIPEPPAGWTGFFIELVYPSGGLYPYKFTTEVRVVPPTLPYAADLDDDGDVDQTDLASFRACMTGANLGPITGQCVLTDLDKDNDVDQADFGRFQRCLSGPGVPLDPSCMKY